MTFDSFRIRGADGEPILGDLHLPARAQIKVPLVVFVHGFKGFKDWGPWAAIAERLCESGIGFLRFNLSHCGVGEDLVDFSALDKFGRNTVGAELFDLHAVLDAVSQGAIVPRERVELGDICLWGHSRGGAAVLLAAAERAEGDIASVVTWAAISTYDRGWPEEHIEMWKRGETVHILNARTGQQMPIGAIAYEDYVANGDRYRLESAVQVLGKRNQRLLVVHGTEDPSVPVIEGRRIRGWYEGAGGSELTYAEVEGADHTFQARHPFESWSDELEQAYMRTHEFLIEKKGNH